MELYTKSMLLMLVQTWYKSMEKKVHVWLFYIISLSEGIGQQRNKFNEEEAKMVATILCMYFLTLSQFFL